MSTEHTKVIAANIATLLLIILVIYGVTRITDDHERRIQRLEQKK